MRLLHVALLALPAVALGHATPELRGVRQLFMHGEAGLPCVRSPSLLAAGGRVLAFVERWNYTGNHCLPRGQPPVQNLTEEIAAYQEYAMRTSDDGGTTWSAARRLPLPINAWNLQTVYFDGVILMHVKEKSSGHIFQFNSTDLGETWGGLRDISSFFPRDLADPVSGMRPSYGTGIVVPSSLNARGRILMTGYDHGSPLASCHVYTSDDGGETWRVASSIAPAFECAAAWLGAHNVYVNARHRGAGRTRVQATSLHDGFKLTVNRSLGKLLDPSQAGVLGGLTAVPTSNAAGGRKSRELWFAIANGSTHAPAGARVWDQREDLTLHRSIDHGVHWDVHHLWRGYSGYCALATIPVNAVGRHVAVGVLWETGGDAVNISEAVCQEACAVSFAILPVD